VTLGLPPEKLTRAPADGGCSPSKLNSTPAFASDSLNFIMFSTSFASGMVPGAAVS
jgi:hypothetical protein